MKILITGAAGFTAYNLVKFLTSENAFATQPNEFFFTSLKVVKPDDSSHYFECDLRQTDSVYLLISAIKPDQIYHLAGAFTNDYEVDYAANVLSTKNILDAVLKSGLQTKVLLVGSAAEYGAISEAENPIKETHPLKPVSLYGLTKVYQTNLMDYYSRILNMNIVMARTFNIFGKGMSNRLFVGRIHEQIEKYKRQEISGISVGNLTSKRDYLAVEDAVKHYQTIMACGVSGEVYNVGSGYSIKMNELLLKILEEASLSHDVIQEQVHKTNKQVDIIDIYADMNKTKAIEIIYRTNLLVKQNHDR